jgi:cytoskeletal protein CcmA (bactofilin family)
MIGPSIVIKGTVSGDEDLLVQGRVEGSIELGSEKVVISKSGNVRGNIVAPRVTLEDGAKFKGSIDMDPGESAGSTVSLAAQRSVDAPAEDLAGTPLEQKSG